MLEVGSPSRWSPLGVTVEKITESSGVREKVFVPGHECDEIRTMQGVARRPASHPPTTVWKATGSQISQKRAPLCLAHYYVNSPRPSFTQDFLVCSRSNAVTQYVVNELSAHPTL